MQSTEPRVRREPTPVDPRPDVVERDGAVLVMGQRCTACGYPVAIEVYCCPVCRGPMKAAEFGPEGVVWSSTVLRIVIPGRRTPYVIAWVNLIDGPRILAHVSDAGEVYVAVGQTVTVAGRNDTGDLIVCTGTS